MKNNSHRGAPAATALREEDIREYAYHLYEQSGCSGGKDLDNWLEAEACLRANIPKQRSHARLHRHLQGELAGVSPPVASGPGL